MVKLQPKLEKIAISIVLLLCICFVAYAIYSPLHVHKNGYCSLNSVEHQSADTLAPAIIVPDPAILAVYLAGQADSSPFESLQTSTLDRGPPSRSC